MNKNKTKNIIKKIKISLAVTGAFHLSMNAGVCGQFELDDISRETYKIHYNNLPAVEESDANLKASLQFDSFMKEAEEIVTRYELESAIGLRLIHRHFTLGDKQVMAEGYEVVDKVPSLVTYAHSFDEAEEKGAVPASWIFSGSSQEEIQLFEASTDSAVKSGSLQLQKSPEFFDEMGKILEEYNLNNLLSVAILKRESLIAEKGQKYTEVNSIDKRSVVQLWDKNDKSQSTIRTSWSFKGPREQDCLPIFDCFWGLGPLRDHAYLQIDHRRI